MANLGDKGKFRQKLRVCLNSSRVRPNIQNEMTKNDMLTVGDFYNNDKFGENSDFGKK